MWPVCWSCLVAAACVMQAILPMGDPSAISNLVTNCFAAAPDPTDPGENADESDDALPSALTTHRLGGRRFALAVPVPLPTEVRPQAPPMAGVCPAAFGMDSLIPVITPLRC